MATADDADKAIKKLNQYQIGHKRLKVAYSLPSGERTRNINLYIKVDDLQYYIAELIYNIL